MHEAALLLDLSPFWDRLGFYWTYPPFHKGGKVWTRGEPAIFAIFVQPLSTGAIDHDNSARPAPTAGFGSILLAGQIKIESCFFAVLTIDRADLHNRRREVLIAFR
jgi:hypothetical protein